MANKDQTSARQGIFEKIKPVLLMDFQNFPTYFFMNLF